VTVPYGTRSLFITCTDSKDKQFRGIRQILRNLAELPASCFIDWSGGVLDLDSRRVLVRVLISGHGRENTAGIELSSKRGLRPQDLRLPHNTKLYLMGCFQGREQLRRTWAFETGIALDGVYGCTAESESALTTCLLLHLLEGGIEAIDRWFGPWMRCNDALRPYFPAIRDSYSRQGANPLATLIDLKASGFFTEAFRDFDEFLGVINRHPAYLTDLM
jgi:hypothetical protein